MRGCQTSTRVIFFADTVQIGEQHIVAICDTGDYFSRFTTRESLIPIEKLDDVLEILNPTNRSAITKATFYYEWQGSVYITVTGHNLIEGNLSARLTGDVFSMNFHIDNAAVCCSSSIVDGLVPFNIITDQRGSILIGGENNDGASAIIGLSH